MRHRSRLQRARGVLMAGSISVTLGFIANVGAQTLPPAISGHVARLTSYCEAGHSAEGLVRVIEISDDGQPDYLVNDGVIRCQGDDIPPYCGATGHCSYTIFVSVGDGFTQVDHFAQTFEVGTGFITVDSERLRWDGTAFAAE